MQPRELVQAWVEAFNRADVDALAGFYAEDAANHQVAEWPMHGRDAIRRMLAAEFASASMFCIVEHIFEDGEWAILEWRDPLGLEGRGFFHVVRGEIVFQRGYWDKLTFLRTRRLPMLIGRETEAVVGDMTVGMLASLALRVRRRACAGRVPRGLPPMSPRVSASAVSQP